MTAQVQILTPHPEQIPRTISRELRAIVEHAQNSFPEYPLPTIVVRVGCFFRTSPRNFAAVAAGDPSELHICEDLEEQPLARIRGILYHEMGHIFQWIERDLTGHNRLRGRDYEQDCDHKIEKLCGIKILYDAELIQQTGPGAFGFRPRPRGLK